MRRFDNVLPNDKRELVNNLLHTPAGWEFGWRSNVNGQDGFKYWHKHFAGHRKVDDPKDPPYDCAKELQQRAPLLYGFWLYLQQRLLIGHTLVRCYANGHTYGLDGMVHRDAKKPNDFTSVYYPHDRWSPNWGGETVFFDKEEKEIIWSCYPAPNRLVVFPGMVPHVARGVSRICPILRVTLMFKTQSKPNGHQNS